MNRSARNPFFVVMSSTPYRGHQLYEQRLARALAADAGVRVLYVQPPTALWSRARGLARRTRVEDVPRLDLVTPWVLPGSRRRGLHHLNTVSAAAAVLAGSLRAGRRPTAVVSAQDVDAVVAVVVKRLLRSRLTVLLKDDYVAGAELIGVPRERLVAARERTFRHADDVVVVSPRLRRVVRAAGRDAHVIPAGAALATGEQPGGGGVRRGAVFLGMVSDRIDFDLLLALAGAGVPLTLIGRRQPTFTQEERWRRLLRDEHVEWTGELPPEQVRARLATCAVGLLPYTLSEFNQASFPLKVLEYLAAGLPVVASRLEAVEWLDAPDVVVAADAAGFVARTRHFLDASPASAEQVRRRRRFSEQHTWEERVRRWRPVLLPEPGRPPLDAAVAAGEVPRLSGETP